MKRPTNPTRAQNFTTRSHTEQENDETATKGDLRPRGRSGLPDLDACKSVRTSCEEVPHQRGFPAGRARRCPKGRKQTGADSDSLPPSRLRRLRIPGRTLPFRSSRAGRASSAPSSPPPHRPGDCSLPTTSNKISLATYVLERDTGPPPTSAWSWAIRERSPGRRAERPPPA